MLLIKFYTSLGNRYLRRHQQRTAVRDIAGMLEKGEIVTFYSVVRVASRDWEETGRLYKH